MNLKEIYNQQKQKHSMTGEDFDVAGGGQCCLNDDKTKVIVWSTPTAKSPAA